MPLAAVSVELLIGAPFSRPYGLELNEAERSSTATDVRVKLRQN